jgi:hypothetical protein
MRGRNPEAMTLEQLGEEILELCHEKARLLMGCQGTPDDEQERQLLKMARREASLRCARAERYVSGYYARNEPIPADMMSPRMARLIRRNASYVP